MRHPTIAALAPRLQSRADPAGDTRRATDETQSDADPATASSTHEPPPLTPIQHWFLAQQFPSRSHFNQSLLLRLPDQPDAERLQAAIDILWQRHDGLRLVFGGDPGSGWQRILPAAEAPRLTTLALPDEQALSADAGERQRGFVTDTGPLFRAVRYRLPDGDRLFLCA